MKATPPAGDAVPRAASRGRNGDRRRTLLVALALAVLTAAVYAPLLTHDFVSYDDPDYVTDNPHVTAGLGLDGVRWALTSFRSTNWHPLTWLSHMADCELYGLDPRGHHLTSLWLHLANVLLTFGVLRAATGAVWRSALVAALFGLHPLHVESVAWVAERKDVLSAAFGLAAIGAWVRYARGGRRGAYAGALGLLALGLAAKPMLVSWPLLLLLLDVWPLRRTGTTPWSRLLAEKLPFAVLAAGSAALTLAAQHAGGATAAGRAIGLAYRAANAVLSYARYLEMTVWPHELAVFYPHPWLPGGTPAAGWKVAAAAALLAAITALALRARRRGYPLAGWAWYGLTLVPVIGLVQVGEQAGADRYTYLPLTGIFIVVAWGAGDLVAARPRARGPVVALAVVALAACAGLTRAQLAVWRDSTTLYARALAVAPDSFTMLENAGLDLLDRGRAEEAIELERRALAQRPDSASARYNLALALHAAGRLDEAVAGYRRAIEADPRHADAHANLCAALWQLRRLEEAAGECRAALEIAPGLADPHTTLGNVLGERGDLEGAVREYGLALEARPGDADALANLGVLLLRQGRYEQAAQRFRQALGSRPGMARAQEGLRQALRGLE